MKFAFFSIFALFYSFLIRAVVFLYNKKIFISKSPANSFIVSVGNISVGGTGKTPMIAWLLKELTQEGFSCGVISRGYGRVGYKKTIVLSKKTTTRAAGDEPYMLHKEHLNVPIIVGSKTKASFLMKDLFNPDIILVDDGFQSFGLRRNLDVVLIDLSRPLSDYFVMPAGLLREPLTGLSRADVVVFTKSNLSGGRKKIKDRFLTFINKNTLILDSSFKSSLFLFDNSVDVFVSRKEVKGPAVCFSGIANPGPFIEQAGLFCKNVISFISFRDHYQYKKRDFRKIRSLMDSHQAKSIVTTKKDFWKVKGFLSEYDIYIIDVQHIINRGDKLINLISLTKN